MKSSRPGPMPTPLRLGGKAAKSRSPPACGRGWGWARATTAIGSFPEWGEFLASGAKLPDGFWACGPALFMAGGVASGHLQHHPRTASAQPELVEGHALVPVIRNACSNPFAAAERWQLFRLPHRQYRAVYGAARSRDMCGHEVDFCGIARPRGVLLECSRIAFDRLRLSGCEHLAHVSASGSLSARPFPRRPSFRWDDDFVVRLAAIHADNTPR